MSASSDPAVKTLRRSLIGKNETQLRRVRVRSGANGFTDNRNSEEAEHNRRNGGKEFDVRFDEFLLVRRSDFAHVNGGGDADRHRNNERDNRNQNRSDQQAE